MTRVRRSIAACPRSLLICSFCFPSLLLPSLPRPSLCSFAQVCTEAGMFAIRVERNYVIEEDLLKAVRKIAEVKKLEGKRMAWPECAALTAVAAMTINKRLAAKNCNPLRV